MRKTFKTLMVTCGFAAVLPLFAVTAASAGGPSAIKAVTHSSGHPDTTSVSSTCTGTSDNGPVWAYDNLSLQLVAVPDGVGKYAVTITAHGSFAAMADPITGACYDGRGSVDGWYQLEVTSASAPDPSNLPAQVPGSLGQGAIVGQFFGGSATSIDGGHYSYTYNRVGGGKYTQVG